MCGVGFPFKVERALLIFVSLKLNIYCTEYWSSRTPESYHIFVNLKYIYLETPLRCMNYLRFHKETNVRQILRENKKRSNEN